MPAHTWKPTPRRVRIASGRRGLAIALVLALSLLPGASYAQPGTFAQSYSAASISLTAQELGPEWAVSSQDSDSFDGTELHTTIFSSPSGRRVRVTTSVARSIDLAEAVITHLRYELDDEGAVITSVQSNGFGDGRAFRAEFSDGVETVVSYLFRVHNLTAFVDYEGAASAVDVNSQALSIARKQETRLFAAIAPPTPAPSPTPAATAVPTPAATSTPAPTSAPVVDTPVVVQSAAPYCAEGEKPQFRLGFATLSAHLGDQMGAPTSCEYADPRGSGDTLQNTDKGLNIYRQGTNTPTFTNGGQHWALTPDGIVYWVGDGIDPPATAQLIPS